MSEVVNFARAIAASRFHEAGSNQGIQLFTGNDATNT